MSICGSVRLSLDKHGLFHRFHRKYIQTTDSEHDLCSGLPICCSDILMTLASMRLGAVILLTFQQTRVSFT